MISFEQIEKLFSCDSVQKCGIEIEFRLKESEKFDFCCMGLLLDKRKKRNVYWYGLTPDGENAYDFATFEEMAAAPVFDGLCLCEIWDRVELLSFDACDPMERIRDFIDEGLMNDKEPAPKKNLVEARKLTEAQKKYKAFERRRIWTVIAMTVLLIVLLMGLVVGLLREEEDATLFLISSGASVVYTVIVIYICPKIIRRHEELYSAACGNNRDVVHTGLFGEIWRSFDAAPYGEIAGGKVKHMEVWNNSIELDIRRNGHAFGVVIDPEGMYMVVDEEENSVREMEMSLAEIPDAEKFFAILEEFIRENS